MRIVFYTFAKKLNSTKQPTDAGTEFNVVLKDGCSILNPSIMLTSVENPTSYNYAYIPDFKRYYFLSDWTAYRDRWTVNGSVDVLASWKSGIGSSIQYIGRAESAYNGNVVDERYTTVGGYRQQLTFLSNPPLSVNNIQEGSFVINVANSLGTDLGSCFYVTDHVGYNAIRKVLYGNDFFDLIKNGLWSPGDFILSCRWYPCKIPTIGVEVPRVQLGNQLYDLPDGATVKFMNPSVAINFVGGVEIPKHPQAAERGKYLNLSPYSRHALLFPPFGLIDVDPSPFYNYDKVAWRLVVDPISGVGTLMLLPPQATMEDPGGLCSVYQANIAVDFPLSAREIDIGGLVSNGVSAVSSVSNAALTAASGVGVVAAGVAGGMALASIGNAVKSAVPSVQNITSYTGSVGSYTIKPRLVSSFINIAEQHSDEGRPLMEPWEISELSGFVQVIDPHFEIAMTDTEMTELNRLASTGFFYE